MMKTTKNERLTSCNTLDELLDVEYGAKGSSERDQFDDETRVFCLAETLKEERRRAGLTQEQLAEKIGTKKSYISRIENGKSDVQLSTLFRIFEGLGRHVNLTIV